MKQIRFFSLCGSLLLATFSANPQTVIEKAEYGDMVAQFQYAEMLLNGNGVEKDSLAAADWLLHSAAGGFCSPASPMRGDIEIGFYGKAFHKLIELTKIGNSPNQHYFLALLGCFYNEIAKDYWNAEKYFKMAIDKGSALGVIELGIMYFYISANAPDAVIPGYVEGEIVDIDDYLEFEHKHPFLLLENWKMENNDSVVSYLKKKKWTETDNTAYWLNKAIAYGYGNFQYGVMSYTIYDHLLFAYVDGIGAKRNLEYAVNIAATCLSDKTTEDNDEFAERTLSIAKEKIERQWHVLVTYHELYQLALEDKNECSKNCQIISAAGLGKCYYKGLGAEKNYKLAFKYLAEAAKGNCRSRESMRLLSACYRYGRGTKVNKEEEIRWLEKAAYCGDDRAKKILNEYRK